MLGIFLDSETNGLNPFIHETIDIAFKIIDLKNSKTLYSYSNLIFQPKEIWEKSDPESLKVNGFSYDMIKNSKEKKDIAKEITEIFLQLNIERKNSVFICQNPSFDRIFFSKIISPEIQENLLWPYHWLDLASMYWALKAKEASPFKNFKGFSKDQIAKSLNLPPEEKPHKAINGVNHLILCYQKLVGFPEGK